jgi:hypothetical protein
MVQRKTINFTSTTNVRDLTTDNNSHNLPDKDFFLAIGLRGYNLLDDDVKKYLTFSIQEIHWKARPDRSWETTIKDLEYEKCGDNFRYDNKDIVKQFEFDEYI